MAVPNGIYQLQRFDLIIPALVPGQFATDAGPGAPILASPPGAGPQNVCAYYCMPCYYLIEIL